MAVASWWFAAARAEAAGQSESAAKKLLSLCIHKVGQRLPRGGTNQNCPDHLASITAPDIAACSMHDHVTGYLRHTRFHISDSCCLAEMHCSLWIAGKAYTQAELHLSCGQLNLFPALPEVLCNVLCRLKQVQQQSLPASHSMLLVLKVCMAVCCRSYLTCTVGHLVGSDCMCTVRLLSSSALLIAFPTALSAALVRAP